MVRRGGTRVARRLSSWVRPEQHHVAAIAEGRFNGLGDPASTTRIAREVIADGIPLDPARSLNPARSQARYSGLGFGQQATQSLDERWGVLARCLPERLLRDAKIFVDHDVPHGAHLRPWQVGIGRDHVLWNVARSLTNDAEAEADASTVFSSARNDARSMSAVYGCTRSRRQDCPRCGGASP